jgi:hypothetical protein
MTTVPEPQRGLTVLTRVCCLECGHSYAKPTRGGTVERNPGCPRCGYVGWIPASAGLRVPDEPARSAVGRRRGRVSPRS